jgi:hypothetical protein
MLQKQLNNEKRPFEIKLSDSSAAARPPFPYLNHFAYSEALSNTISQPSKMQIQTQCIKTPQVLYAHRAQLQDDHPPSDPFTTRAQHQPTPVNMDAYQSLSSALRSFQTAQQRYTAYPLSTFGQAPNMLSPYPFPLLPLSAPGLPPALSALLYQPPPPPAPAQLPPAAALQLLLSLSARPAAARP